MKKVTAKGILPYVLIPIIGVGVFVTKRNSLDGIMLLLYETLLAFVLVAAVIDLKEKRVPNELVLIMFGAWILILVPQLFLHTDRAIRLAINGVIGFAVAGVLFILVYLISRKGIGGGDVKLMAVSGLYLGLNGVFPTMLIGSIVASLTGVVLIALKKIGRRDPIPLVPFLYAGMVLTIFMQ